MFMHDDDDDDDTHARRMWDFLLYINIITFDINLFIKEVCRIDCAVELA